MTMTTTITRTMDLNALADHMGTEATQEDALRMFDLFVEGYEGQAIEDIPEGEWLSMLNQTQQLKDYRIYHRDEAGQPSAHQGEGPWYFEPSDWPGEQVYSDCYATYAEARDAAQEDADRRE